MANPTNGNGNIVDEFEEAFHSCLQVLTKEDEVSTTLEKDEIKLEIDQATLKFLDLARQMEAFFLQKRFLLSALKPELIVKEDIVDLRHDLARKEELIKRHYDKIAVWQNLLSDLQGWAKSPAHQGSTSSASGTTPPNSSTPSGPGISGMGGPLPGMMSGMNPIGPGSNMQALSNMPQSQQVQMQQQMHMQHMQVSLS
uniref:Mediator of RNA polymerase II transcription subunit 28 n=1 Tax=Cacopsylla melanoneura TaxID=428564 RepID=A0A8D8RIQ8_9HEMI